MSRPVNGSPKVGRRYHGALDRTTGKRIGEGGTAATLLDKVRPMPKGRPPDDEAKREVKVQIRAMATQRAAWHAAAALAGKDLSEWLRDLADKEAARETR